MCRAMGPFHEFQAVLKGQLGDTYEGELASFSPDDRTGGNARLTRGYQSLTSFNLPFFHLLAFYSQGKGCTYYPGANNVSSE